MIRQQYSECKNKKNKKDLSPFAKSFVLGNIMFYGARFYPFHCRMRDRLKQKNGAASLMAKTHKRKEQQIIAVQNNLESIYSDLLPISSSFVFISSTDFTPSRILCITSSESS